MRIVLAAAALLAAAPAFAAIGRLHVAVDDLLGRAVHGRAAIQATFDGVFGAKAKLKFTVTPTRIWSDGDTGFITWEANGGAFKGGDTYLVRDGKIIAQAVFIGGAPPAQAQ